MDRNVEVTPSTYVTEPRKVIRKSDNSLRINTSHVFGRQGLGKPTTRKRAKIQHKISTSTSWNEPQSMKVPAPTKELTATSSMSAPGAVQAKLRNIASKAGRTSTPLKTPPAAVPIINFTRSSYSSSGIINPPVANFSPIDQLHALNQY